MFKSWIIVRHDGRQGTHTVSCSFDDQSKADSWLQSEKDKVYKSDMEWVVDSGITETIEV